MGKSVIQLSLKTKDFNEAAKLRNMQDVEWDARFEKVSEQSDAPSQTKSVLSRHDALKIVRETYSPSDGLFHMRHRYHAGRANPLRLGS